MIKSIFIKLISVVATLFLVSLMIFLVFQILPGNPAEIMLGVDAEEVEIKALEKELGLDKPYLERYRDWISDLVKGDMGKSIKYQVPVKDLFADRFPLTLFLTLYSLIITILIGIPLGIWISSKDGKWYSSFFSVLSQIGISIPTFWLAFLLILTFSVKLGWFPVIGSNLQGESFLLKIYKFFLPSLAIAVGNMATIIRYLRTAILDQINQDYVRTAKMKGMALNQILYKHILRNALIPVLTIIGIMLTHSIGGSIIIENVFAIPGIGSLVVQSISSRDFPLIQSVIIAIASIVIAINLVIDILYQLIDPRIRSGKV